MSRASQREKPSITPDMLSHYLADIAQQLNTLNKQTQETGTKLDRVGQDISQIPRLPRILIDTHPLPKLNSTDDITNVLLFGEQSSRRREASYYQSFGGLYLVNALVFFLGMQALHTIPIPIRIIASALFLLIGIGNFLCLILPTERQQKSVVYLTVVASFLILFLSVFADVQIHQPLAILVSASFWIGAIFIHIRFSRSIRGCLLHRALTRQMIHNKQEQKQG